VEFSASCFLVFLNIQEANCRMPETLPKSLERELGVLIIDNFDSFTWNLYQQFCLEGADVTVIRNDAIPPSLFPLLKIKYLVISPGPGHPKTDSGISNAAIEYFQGKVPVLGVCMGLECLVDLHGGEIAYVSHHSQGVRFYLFYHADMLAKLCMEKSAGSDTMIEVASEEYPRAYSLSVIIPSVLLIPHCRLTLLSQPSVRNQES
jgi:hypothetical protein